MGSGDQISVEMRLAAIEEKLHRLLAHLGLDDDGGSQPAVAETLPRPLGIEAELVALIKAGKKIQAIKVYREATDVGLKVAKNTIDAMERDLRARGGWR